MSVVLESFQQWQELLARQLFQQLGVKERSTRNAGLTYLAVGANYWRAPLELVAAVALVSPRNTTHARPPPPPPSAVAIGWTGGQSQPENGRPPWEGWGGALAAPAGK